MAKRELLAMHTEKELVTLIKTDNHQAFKSLYLLYHARIFNFCLKMLSDHEDAKDIVQRVFVTLWEQRMNIDEEKPVGTYIYTLARYSIYQSFRKKIYRSAAYEFLMNRDPKLENVTLEEVIFSELEQFLDRIINSLPEKRKEVFKLNRKDGLTYQEIAAKLGISENTVDTQIRKSLQFIRQEYEKQYK